VSTALRFLKHFIRAKNNDEERAEIRAYALENRTELAAALGIAPQAYKDTVHRIDDDERLARALLEAIKVAARRRRAYRVADREAAAQQSADVLASAAYWRDGCLVVDIVSLLATVLTRPSDLLVFTSDAWPDPVAIPMEPLFRLAKLERVDLSAYVTERGLHVRWTTGGLLLHPFADPNASRIVVADPTAGKAAA
jgi:hypothetical protein